MILPTNSEFHTCSVSTADSNVHMNHRSPTESRCGGSEPQKSTIRCNVSEKCENLIIINVNCRSLRSQNKAVDLISLMKEHNANIVIGTESWLTSEISDAEVFPADFVVYRKDRSAKVGGGVFVACHASLRSRREQELETDVEIVWCSVQDRNGGKVYISSFYRPPDSDDAYMDQFLASLTCAKDVCKGRKLICGGDFNLPDIEWATGTVTPGGRHQVPSSNLINCLNDLGLEQLVTSPTRVHNILDLVITNSPQYVQSIEVCEGISDHSIVVCDFHLKLKIKQKKKRKVFCYGRADFDIINSKLTEEYTTYIVGFHDRSVEENWRLFSDTVQSVVLEYVPSKMVKSNGDPVWYDKCTRKAEAKQRRLHGKAKRTGRAEDLEKYREARREARTLNRAAHANYVNKLGECLKGDTKPFWRYVKSKKGSKVGISCLKDPDGVETSNPLKMANILNNQFKSVFTVEDRKDGSDLVIDPGMPMPPVNITYNGIVKLLKDLDVKKASGPDNISNKLLKYSSEVLALFLCNIFKQSLDHGVIPEEWCKALVCPIYKDGSKTDPGNYRPISLTCVCCKIMEHILGSSIMKHLDENNLLSPAQHGFRKGLSCETQLVMLTDMLGKALDTKQSVDAIFLDFSKAFDRVPHGRLISKLSSYNLDDKVIAWIKSFVSHREQRVVLDGELSDPVDVTSGVPQGSVLGPLLFLLYINDISDQMRCQVRLFADDCVLYSMVDTNQASSEEIRHGLTKVVEWCDKWLMKLNVKKCAAMRISRKKDIVTPSYNIRGDQIDVVNEYKYLGVKMTKNLSWNHHVEGIVAKANKNLRFVKRVFKESPKNVKESVYMSLVRPLVEYACAVWDPNPGSGLGNDVEMVQRRAARFVMSRYGRNESVTDMLSELEWQTLESRRMVARLALFYKMYHHHIPLDISETVLPPSYTGPRDHTCKVNRVPSRLLQYHSSFFPRTIRQWNNLHPSIVDANTVETFKSRCVSLCKDAARGQGGVKW